jgi:crossover junction endodeoxyribonuclease RusA
MAIEMTLPWPPTVNHIWKRGKRGMYLTDKGKDFYRDAVAVIHSQVSMSMLTERLDVTIDLYPPDRRKWDIDNRTKCVLDACTRAGVWEDDELIDRLVVERHERDPGKQGFAVVTVRPREASA